MASADTPLGGAAPRRLRGVWGFAAALLLWTTMMAAYLRPTSIVTDWNGWRQADTATIALEFLSSGDSMFFPRVRWGGGGPGYVESELAVYAYLLSLLMRVFGPYEMVGQLLSLTLVAGGAALLFVTCRRVLGEVPAWGAAAAFLATRSVVFVSTAVQPEPLSLLLGIGALSLLLRWRETPEQKRWLASYAVVVAIACLSKPTAFVALVAGAVVCTFDPTLRRHWRVTLVAHGFVALLGAAYLLHARALYLRYGNTFGLLSGGDRKTPLLEHLIHPGFFLAALRVEVVWGAGLIGFLALLMWAGLRWRSPSDGPRGGAELVLLGLLLGEGAWITLSLRYSTNVWFGSHYHLFGGLVAGLAVALALTSARELTPGVARRAAVAAIALTLLAQTIWVYPARASAARTRPEESPEFAAARALEEVAEPESLVVVRSRAERHDTYWKTRNNFEDPVVFYVARVRGWVLPLDATDPAELDAWQRSGAEYFVDPMVSDLPRPLSRWLEARGVPVATTEQGRIWRLHD